MHAHIHSPPHARACTQCAHQRRALCVVVQARNRAVAASEAAFESIEESMAFEGQWLHGGDTCQLYFNPERAGVNHGVNSHEAAHTPASSPDYSFTL